MYNRNKNWAGEYQSIFWEKEKPRPHFSKKNMCICGECYPVKVTTDYMYRPYFRYINDWVFYKLDVLKAYTSNRYRFLKSLTQREEKVGFDIYCTVYGGKYW